MKTLYKYINEKFQITKDSKYVANNQDVYDATSFAPGDILVAVFSYSMTLVKFYKVIANNGKTVTTVQIPSKIASGNYFQGTCVPDESNISNDQIKTRIRKGNVLKISDYRCRLWNGEPEMFDHLD